MMLERPSYLELYMRLTLLGLGGIHVHGMIGHSFDTVIKLTVVFYIHPDSYS
jgi:hypothetical protein